MTRTHFIFFSTMFYFGSLHFCTWWWCSKLDLDIKLVNFIEVFSKSIYALKKFALLVFVYIHCLNFPFSCNIGYNFNRKLAMKVCYVRVWWPVSCFFKCESLVLYHKCQCHVVHSFECWSMTCNKLVPNF
jgi:hypothetical protein